MTKLWGGRFSEGTAASVEEFTQSVEFDRRLWAQDVRGSIAHVRMLARQGVVSAEDAARIEAGLEQVRTEIESGKFEWKAEREDVHMNVEARLTEIIGEAGGRLHAGRSRNDQVALDFRLFVAERLSAWRTELVRLVATFVERAGENREVLLPGCTHFQPAQPVSLAHHLLAYAWMFKRDVERIDDALDRVRVSPLGAAALAGTTYPLDPAYVAEQVGFPEIFGNSLDAVSDRDFVLEGLFVGSMVMTHLSRFCEEIIIWANPAFGFVALPDAYSTGSSIMPQKKNPDVAELMRGKVGRVHGSLVAMLTTMKALPLAYNRDMQEDKEPFLDADRTVFASVSIMADMLKVLGFKPDRMRAALSAGFLNATELADYLVVKGMPFREAHHVSGRAVALAESRGAGLEDLTLADYKALSPMIEADVFEALKYETAVARRNAPGGTGPQAVERQIETLKGWLAGR